MLRSWPRRSDYAPRNSSRRCVRKCPSRYANFASPSATYNRDRQYDLSVSQPRRWALAMTVRLQMKLGVVADTQRLPDSPDAILVVEPSVGSTARTKGNLYLLVTASGGRRLRDATRMVAERIRDEYYYDESAGISGCLQKAIRSANKRLLHSNDRLVSRQGEPGPIGLAVAVVRGNELYVATLGPAEAYLVRQARLLTLPEVDPNSGLPAQDVADTEVWHGEIVVGDCLALVTPNVTRRLGLSPIQDALVQLHPQSAIEQIHRQLTGGGIGVTGGDGMIAIGASGVGPRVKTQPQKPVWPSDPLAGTPDRSPIPLGDQVSDGVADLIAQRDRRAIGSSGEWVARPDRLERLGLDPGANFRSEERRGGEEGRSRGSPYHA